MHHLKYSLKSSLYKSFLSWELGITVIHLPSLQDCYRFLLVFSTMVAFMAPIQPFSLSTPLSLTASHLSLTWLEFSLRSDTYPRREAMRTSQHCYDVLKLLGGVQVDFCIPMITCFIPQVVLLGRLSVSYYLLIPYRAGMGTPLMITPVAQRDPWSQGLSTEKLPLLLETLRLQKSHWG